MDVFLKVRLRRILSLLIFQGFLFPLWSLDIAVTSTSDDGSVGTLRYAIDQINASPGTYSGIDFSSLTNPTITLTKPLPMLSIGVGNTLNTVGTTSSNIVTIDGASSYRGLLLLSGTLNLTFVNFQNCKAKGGNGGGFSEGGGGGGAGLGGGLFLYTDSSAVLDGVNFSSNQAVGGNGGADTPTVGGGGGGLGGNGGSFITGVEQYGGGGGGGGYFGNGGDSSGGRFVAVGGGGGGGVFQNGGDSNNVSTGGAGGSDGGGDGGSYPGSGQGGTAIGGGGGGGSYQGAGGNGQPFGGGGAGGGVTNAVGGNGGFGGGGGSAALFAFIYGGGSGGFGGGGGGGFGAGGYGGGNGGTSYNPYSLGPGCGGGGAGFGGAVFLMQGATLSLQGSNSFSLSGNSVTAGFPTTTIGGGTPATSGTADGSDFFLHSGSNLNFSQAGSLTISGSIGGDALNSPGTITVNGGSTAWAGANTFRAAVNVSGTTLQISTNTGLGNSSNVATLDNSGTLKFAGNLAVVNPIVLGGTGTQVLDSQSFAVSLNGNVSGTGPLVKQGSGSVTLNGTNSFSNTLQVSAGSLILSTAAAYSAASIQTGATLQAGANNVFPSSAPITIANGASAQLNLNNFSQTVSQITGGGSSGGTINLGSGTLTWGDATNQSFGGAIIGVGGIIKQGSGILTLSGTASTYSGSTQISVGTLQAGGANTLSTSSTVAVSSGAFFDLNNTANTIANLSGAGNVTLGSGSLTFGGDDQSKTFSGAISGTGGSLTKTGSGTFTFSGTSTYTGSTLINAGTMQILNGSLSSQSAVQIGMSGTLDLNGFSQTISNLSGLGSLNLGSATLTFGSDNNPSSFSGGISGTSGSLVKQGNGTNTLSGTNTFTGTVQVNGGSLVLSGSNVYSGATTLSSSTLQAGAANALSANSAITIDASSTFDLNNFSNTVANFSGAGNVTLGSGTLTFGGNNGSGTVTGVVSAANGGLVKNGNGTSTLSGANTLTGTTSLQVNGGTLNLSGNNDYSGATSVTGGSTLRAGSANGISPNSAITFGTLSTLDLNGFDTTVANISGPCNISLGSSTLTFGSNGATTTISGGITGSGNLIKQGSGTTTINSTSSFTGSLQVSGGKLILGSGNSYSGTTSVTASILEANGANVFSSNSLVNLSASGTLNLNNFSNAIGNLTGSGSVTLGTGSLTLGSDNGSQTFSGSISGTGGRLIKSGSGDFTLSGTNSYTGGTQINGGTLSITNLNNIGSGNVTFGGTSTLQLGGGISLSTVSIANGVVATINTGGFSSTVSNPITGTTGGLTKTGGGTLTLNGAGSNYSGNTTLTEGTLLAGSATALSTSSNYILSDVAGVLLDCNNFATECQSISGGGASGGDIQIGSAMLTTGYNTTTFSGRILGTSSGSLKKMGGGTLTLNSSNTYGGGTQILEGAIAIGDANALGTGPVSIASNTLQFNTDMTFNPAITVTGASTPTFQLNNATVTLSQPITTGGTTFNAMTFSGTGTLIFGATGNNYSNNTFVNSGVTFKAGLANSLPSNCFIVIPSGGALDLNNFSNSISRLQSGGNVNLGSADLTLTSSTNAISGVVSGSGRFILQGATNLSLQNSSNTFTGGIIVNSPVNISGGGLNTGPIIFNSNGLITLFGVTLNAPITINNNSTVTLINTTVTQPITNPTGTLLLRSVTLSGMNTYAGNTQTTTAGTGMTAGGVNTLSPNSNHVLENAVANLNLNNFSNTIGSLAGGGAAGGNVLLGSATLTLGNSTDTTYAGVISGTGSIVKQGSGTFTLTGTNLYSGGTQISAGTISISNLNQLGTAGLSFTGSGTLKMTSGIDFNRSLTLSNGITASFDTAGSNSSLSTAISSTTAGIAKNGSGILTLNGTGSDYSGSTQIIAGTLQAGGANTLSAASAVDVSSGAIFDLNNTTHTIANLSGAGNVTLGSGALTFGGDDQSKTFTGAISGTGGSLTKTGTGTFTFGGAGTYTGSTVINDGNLQILNGSLSSQSAVQIDASGTLDLNGFSQTIANFSGSGSLNLGSATLAFGSDNNSSSFSGDIAGSGGKLVKQGSGSFSFSGTNTYSGGTDIYGGTVIANSADSLGGGAITFAGTSTLQLNSAMTLTPLLSIQPSVTATIDTQGNNSTLSGNITGTTGNLTKISSGILTLNGASTYGGQTSLNAGALKAGSTSSFSPLSAVTFASGTTLDLNNHSNEVANLSGAGNVTLGSATLTLGANNESSTLSGSISGTGGNLTKKGIGTLTLSGTNTYTGTTEIEAGVFVLSSPGSLQSQVNVNADTRFQGNGTVDNVVQILSGGTIAPGNSIGTLNVAEYVAVDGSTYECEINAAGESDLIFSNTTALFEGQNLLIIPEEGSYNNITEYTILETPDLGIPTVFGNFNLLQTSSLFTYGLTYFNNRVVLRALKLDFPVLEGNPGIVLNYIEDLVFQTPPTSDLGFVITSLANLFTDIPALTYALNQLCSVACSDLRWVLFDQREAVQWSVDQVQKNRRAEILSSCKTLSCCSNQTGIEQSLGQNGGHIWLQPYGQFYDQPSKGLFPGVNANTGGASAGIDGIINDQILLGAFGGGAGTWFDWKQNYGHGSISNYYFGLYSSLVYEKFYADLSLIYGKSWMDTQRNILFIDRKAKGRHRGDGLSEGLEIGYEWEYRSQFFQPFFNLSFYQLKETPYSEKGAGSVNLNVSGNHTNFYRTELGLLWACNWDWDCFKVTPSLKGSWIHKRAFHCKHTIREAFEGQSSFFEIYGDFKVRNLGAIGANLQLESANGLYGQLSYEGEFSTTQNTQNAQVRFGYFF